MTEPVLHLDMTTLNTLEAEGISLRARLKLVNGEMDIALPAAEVPAFLHDRHQYTADKLGVSKADYKAWLKAEGLPRCGSQTADGTRCKKSVSGGVRYDINEWLAEDGGYCTAHGGLTAEEQPPARLHCAALEHPLEDKETSL